MSKIGDELRRLRTNAGFNQVDFANRIGVSKQTLYKYENGIIKNIPIEKIELAARVCGVNPATIMHWNDEEFNKSFSYHVDKQMHMLGYSIMYDSEGYVLLSDGNNTYEITAEDDQNLKLSMAQYLEFLLSGLVRKAQHDQGGKS